MRASGTPVLPAIAPRVSPTFTVYVRLTVVVRVLPDLPFDFVVVDVLFDVLVLAAGVVLESPLAESPFFPDELMIDRRTTITTINAKGAKKRAGLLLAR
jgi:hypothetical protein